MSDPIELEKIIAKGKLNDFIGIFDELSGYKSWTELMDKKEEDYIWQNLEDGDFGSIAMHLVGDVEGAKNFSDIILVGDNTLVYSIKKEYVGIRGPRDVEQNEKDICFNIPKGVRIDVEQNEKDICLNIPKGVRINERYHPQRITGTFTFEKNPFQVPGNVLDFMGFWGGYNPSQITQIYNHIMGTNLSAPAQKK